MSVSKFAGLFGKSRSRKRTRRTPAAKRLARPLALLRLECLEERQLLAGILGTAQDFAVLGHTTVSNTGPTLIFGSADTLANTGVYSAGGANATTGFSSAGNTFVGPGSNTDGPGLVSAPAAIHLGSPVANLARNDLINAYTVLASYGTATNETGHDLGTSGTLPIGTLVAGVYSFDTSAQLNGLLQLDAQGTNGGVWIFQIGTTLTTASASAVRLINPGGNLGADVGVYWVVGSSATLGTTTAFEGNILAQMSITLNTGATIYNGRALAIDGAVTLDTNIISDICPPASSSPNSGPGFSLGGLGSIAWEKRDAAGALLGGAQFTISPDPTDGVGILTIVDNGPGDANPVAGQILVNNALLGTYTITETVAPLGYVIDTDPTRLVSVTANELNPVVGVQGFNDLGITDESDFHNSLAPVSVGSIAWEKRDAAGALLGGAQFTINPDPTDGVGILTIVDNGPGDANPVAGQILVNNALLGTYTITETVAPLGYVIDTDPTRLVNVTANALTQVIGVQGFNDPGVTDESDFHNSLTPVSVGSIAWEKRDAAGALLGGAQFTINPDPTDGIGILTIVDNGPGDADPAAGQILVNNVPPGAYTITETVAPLGYVIDTDPTRLVNVTANALTQVIGVQGFNDAGITDESDFHNTLTPVRVGSIAWEKRDAAGALLGGAQFTINPDPTDGIGILTIVDNGPGDADPAAGQILVNNVPPGAYTITETVAPLGYVIDTDPTRLVNVTANALTQVIGVQGFNDPGVTDESDFHNSLTPVSVGSIAWEKRDAAGALLGGAQFTINPDPTDGIGILTIVDNGPGDADPAAGQILVNNVPPGAYTITETVAPLGYVIDTDPTRLVNVTANALTQVIGVQGFNDAGITDESDFHNTLTPVRVGSIAWEKRDAAGALLGGAQFTINPDPTDGIGILTIVDNGPGDANPAAGQILVNNVPPGAYTITETVAPLGYVIDTDPTRLVNVTANALTQVIGVQGYNDPGVTDESDFHNRKRNVIVIGPGKSPNTPQSVKVIDEESGAVLAQFVPYGNTFQGGVRVATGDLTGDGVDEIVTAPGWGIVAEVRVYTQNGALLTSFQPYGSTFNGGVQVAVGDVDGDRLNDIITVPSYGPAEVKVFRNLPVGGVPKFDGAHPYRDFLAFPSSFIGGAVVATADMGSTPLANGPFDNTRRDQKAEIVVGSGAGMKTTVKVFDVSGMITANPKVVAAAAASFTPFSTTTTSFQGGTSLSVARINADLIPDIVVGAGTNGGSKVDVWAWNNTASAALSSLSANGIGFAAFTGASQTAPVQVAALDATGDGIADAILAVQGPGGTTGQIRAFNVISVAPLQVSPFTTVPGSFPGPYYIATIQNAGSRPAPPTGVPQVALPGLYDPAASVFYLRNANSAGPADTTFAYGPAGAGWKPVAGDWDGDGQTTIGLYDPQTSVFHLRNTNGTGADDYTFGFGDPTAGDRYVLLMGDWNGDGIDTVGLYDRQTAQWFLRNSNTAGYADADFGYGAPNSTWTPLVGDWNGDGLDTVGFYDSVNAIYYLRDSNDTGYAQYTFGYGVPGSAWAPIVGDWDGNRTATIGFYDQANALWSLRNSNDQGTADVAFGFGAPGQGWLPIVGNWVGPAGAPLMAADAGKASAADVTPLTATQPPAIDPLAVDRVDLATVVEHELGYVAGLEDLDFPASRRMGVQLEAGGQRLAGVDAVLGRGDSWL